jgi:amino acid adenylation domain-containing protein
MTTETIKELTRLALAGDLNALRKLRGMGVLPSSGDSTESSPRIYPLSHAQKRLWMFHQLDPANPAYNMPAAFMLEGNLDLDTLDRAFRELIRRHESLRTVFVFDHGSPGQIIRKWNPDEAIVRFMDYSDSPDPFPQASQFALKDALAPFDLTAGPLLRVYLICLSPARERHLMLFNIHHIICDGWSIPILIRELCRSYNAFRSAPPFSPLRIQYKDYAVWQNRLLESPEMEAHRRYWREKLSGDVPVLDLPQDAPRGPMQTFEGSTAESFLPSKMLNSLKTLARKNNASLFMILLAAVKVLLFRYSGQTDIILGSPVAGREHPDLVDQVGFFVNMLPLRDRVKADMPFDAFLNQIRETVLEAYEHQGFPFDRLVEELDLRRDMSRSPLFDAIVVLQNRRETEFSLEGIDIKPQSREFPVSRFDLTFYFEETTGDLIISIQYNTNLFHQDRISRMTAHLNTLFQSILADEKTPLNQLNILPEDERKKIRYEFNHTDAPPQTFSPGNTIPMIFEEHAEKKPEDPAVIFGSIRLTYRDLNEQSSRIAHFLRERCAIRPDDRVAIFVERSHRLIIAMLGIMKSGGACVPIDAAYPPERIRYMLEDSGCRAVLTGPGLLETLAGLSREIPRINILEAADHPDSANPSPVNTPGDLAYVIYTSGSTGRPKGVMIEHGGFINMVRSQIRLFGAGPGDKFLQFSSCSFDASMYESFIALLSGAGLVCVQKSDIESPDDLLRIMTQTGVTLSVLPPSYLRMLGFENLKMLRHLVTAGESAISDEGKFSDGDHHYWNAYGPTEFSVCATCYPVEPGKAYPTGIPIGKPIDNSEVLILENLGTDLRPIGIPGEICLSGPGLARGYLNKPDLTAEKFVPHPFKPGHRMYRTGDLGYWLPDGNIQFLGRIDDQVKIRGFRIEPGEIINRLLEHPDVREAVAVEKKLRNGQQELAVYVTLSEEVDKSFNVNSLRDHIRSALPDYMIPAHFIRLDAIPLTSSGKVDRRALPSPQDPNRYAAGRVAPQNDLEARVADAWKEALRLETVGIHDNFFELGGNSLLLIQVYKHLQQTFEHITVLDLFQHPTIQTLARHLKGEESGPQASTQGRDRATRRADRMSVLRNRRSGSSDHL